MNWFFNLIFLGTTWSAIHVEEVISSERSHAEQECSEAEGFFRVPESGNQCIKILGHHFGNWASSNKACQDEGLQLAKPFDPIAMRKFILDNRGDGRYYWIGGRGSAAGVLWRDGTRLYSNNCAWYPGFPADHDREHKNDQCVKLLTFKIDLKQYPYQPYYIQPCEWKAFPMCELPTVCNEAEGFFRVAESGNQCIKIFFDFPRSWDASNKKCEDEDLQLAKPVNPVALRQWMHHKYGGRDLWLGGRGTNSGVKWRDGSSLSSSNSAWHPGLERFMTNPHYCLKLLNLDGDIKRYPYQPYYIQPCEWVAYAMCEELK